MKILRFVLVFILIAAACGLLAYQGLVTKDLTTSNLVKGLLIIAGGIAALFKKPRQRPVANKKALYQKAYGDLIGNAFDQDPKLEKKFYNAVHDYNRNQPQKGIAKLSQLRRECQRSADMRAVTIFTGLCYDDLGQYKQAIEQYQAARNIRDCSTLASNMGLCYQRLGNFENAQDCYERAIVLDPKNAFAYNNMAAMYFRDGDYESALDCAEDAIELNATLPQALSTAAICCKLIGDEAKYELYYRRAVAAGYDGQKIKNVIHQLDPEL